MKNDVKRWAKEREREEEEEEVGEEEVKERW